MINETRILLSHFHGAFSVWIFAICAYLQLLLYLPLPAGAKGISLENGGVVVAERRKTAAN
ncbi:hypothetical protein KCP71_03345 [Salmonella enterica subsp. enterica]|nr:hypothetical protein KCP71_03345 [Salmonella enterica subsp. enterica]